MGAIRLGGARHQVSLSVPGVNHCENGIASLGMR
jgi:hypothetical protein